MKLTPQEFRSPCNDPAKHDADRGAISEASSTAGSGWHSSAMDQLETQLSAVGIGHRSAVQTQLIAQLPTGKRGKSRAHALDTDNASGRDSVAISSANSLPVNETRTRNFDRLPFEVLMQVPAKMPLGDSRLLSFSLLNKTCYEATKGMRERSSAAYAKTLRTKASEIIHIPAGQGRIDAFNAIMANVVNMVGENKATVLEALATAIRALPNEVCPTAFNWVLAEIPTGASDYSKVSIQVELVASGENFQNGEWRRATDAIINTSSGLPVALRLDVLTSLATTSGWRQSAPEHVETLSAIVDQFAIMRKTSHFDCPSRIGVAMIREQEICANENAIAIIMGGSKTATSAAVAHWERQRAHSLSEKAREIVDMPAGQGRTDTVNAVMARVVNMVGENKASVLDELTKSIRGLPIEERLIAFNRILAEIPASANDHSKVSILCGLIDRSEDFLVGDSSRSANAIIDKAASLPVTHRLNVLAWLAPTIGWQQGRREKIETLCAIVDQFAIMRKISEFDCPSQIGVVMIKEPAICANENAITIIMGGSKTATSAAISNWEKEASQGGKAILSRLEPTSHGDGFEQT